MPKFSDSIKVGTRMNTGSSPQGMNTIGLSGPNAIRAPTMYANQLQFKPYPTPVQKEPHWITNKAIQDFGATLVDVTMSVADRRARLFAYEANKEQKRKLRNLLKLGENAYLLSEESEAIKRREEVTEKIVKIQEETLKGVSNHVKLYLNKEAGATTDWALELVANHVMLQQRKATASAQEGKIEDLQEIVNDTLAPPSEINEEIERSFSTMIFANDVERQSTKDKVLLGSVDMSLSRVMPEGQQLSNAELDRNVDNLGAKIKGYRPYMSEGAQIQAMASYHQAVKAVEAEKNNRRLKEALADQEDKVKLRSLFAGQRNMGAPFPENLARRMVDTGLMDEVEYEYQVAKFKEGKGGGNRGNTPLYTELYMLISQNADFNEWFPRMNEASKGPNPQLIQGQVTSLLSYHESMKDEAYRVFDGSLSTQLKSWIITSGFMGGLRRNEEDDIYAAASAEKDKKLRVLKLSNRLNADEVKLLEDELRIKYGISANIRKQSTFLSVPSGSSTTVTNAAQLQDVLNAIEEQKRKGEIDERTYNSHKSRLQALSVLFMRLNEEKKALKEGRAISEDYEGYPDQDRIVDRPLTDYEMDRQIDERMINRVLP